MKTKSLLFGLLASAAMVSCTNEVDSIENNGAIQAGETNYVSVNLVAPATTRATGDFEDGLPVESEVSKAVFLFLDGNYRGCANPYEVTDLTWTASTATGETKKATTLVIDGIKDEVPAYIVAILNPTSSMSFSASTSLADLKGIFDNYSSKGFVMSNAVYAAENGKEVVATPIKLENIAKTQADLATTDPVSIQVERVVAKVEVANLDAAITELNTNGLKETIDNQEDLKLKFVLTGWEVLQNNQSGLIKNINATAWTIENWNSIGLKRSYWANDYTTAGRTSYKVGELTGKNDEFKYVEETVNQTATTAAALNSVSPYLLVSGKFVDATDETKAIDLVEWRGQKYTKQGYLNLIAGMESVSQYYTEEGGVYTSFTADLLQLVDQSNDWGAKAELIDGTTQFYTVTFKADGKTVDVATPAAIADVKAAIAKFGEVQYWNGGNTYYFVPIKHQVCDATTNFYGVVRNHVYKMNISKINGYGTPVANPNQAIDEPENPEEGNTYMNADVVILDWRIVENEVEL